MCCDGPANPMWPKLLYSEIETWFGPSTQGAGAKTHLKSRFCAILTERGAMFEFEMDWPPVRPARRLASCCLFRTHTARLRTPRHHSPRRPRCRPRQHRHSCSPCQTCTRKSPANTMWRNVCQNGAKSGFEMCFGPSTLGAGAKTRLESRIKEFTAHLHCQTCTRKSPAPHYFA